MLGLGQYNGLGAYCCLSTAFDVIHIFTIKLCARFTYLNASLEQSYYFQLTKENKSFENTIDREMCKVRCILNIVKYVEFKITNQIQLTR